MLKIENNATPVVADRAAQIRQPIYKSAGGANTPQNLKLRIDGLETRGLPLELRSNSAAHGHTIYAGPRLRNTTEAEPLVRAQSPDQRRVATIYLPAVAGVGSITTRA